VVVDHQYLFDAVLVQQRHDFLAAGALAHRHQPLPGRHDGADWGIHVVFETQVAAGDDADQMLVIHHRHARNMMRASQRQHLANGSRRRGYDRG